MSQDIFNSVDPTISGTALATLLNNFKDAIVSGCSGTSRPAELGIGGSWVDMTNDPNSWSYKIWTGTDDVEVFTINLTTGVASVALAVDSFIVKKISADAVGAIVDLVKQRVASGGQVLDGDVVGEIRITGRTDAAGNPVVAKVIWTATDDQTTSAYGGTLSFYSTPEGTNTLTEHMRFIDGKVVTLVPHKINSQILTGQSVATAASITQLSATKVLVELFGATATSLKGINSAHDSKVVTIHNRSSEDVTLIHESGDAAAEDRLQLPESEDIILVPHASAAVYYCDTDSRWKIQSTSIRNSGKTIDTIYALKETWTAPAAVTGVTVTAFQSPKGIAPSRNGMLDIFGSAYAWGLNANGQLGVGNVTPQSSPVAVLGGLTFEKAYSSAATGMSSYGISSIGTAYAWGINTNGQLGDSSVVAKSSPVAVAGGLRFRSLNPAGASCIGVTTGGVAYSWGVNTNGQGGRGTVTAASSPVAVLGSHVFAKVLHFAGGTTSSAALGINKSGAAYTWGINTQGALGLGDVTPRSSPVAVLGGLTFTDVTGSATSARYYFVGLNDSNAAYAWGANTHGQLGVGDVAARSSPVAVLGGLTFERLVTSSDSESVMAFAADGTLYAWGENAKGTLGVGDALSRSSPVAVLGGLTFNKVKVFRQSAFGLTSDGTLYAWGDNTNGQLGVGDVTARSSPVAVLGGLKFADIAAANGLNDQNAVYGITTDGVLYAWGKNANGTLGLGDVAARSSPVAVLGSLSPDVEETYRIYDLTVTAGSSYVVTTGPGVATFGPTPLGRNVYKVEVQYSQ